VFPTEFAGNGRLETDIFRRVPLVDQRVCDQGFVETEYEVSQRFHFIFGVGVFETYEIAVTGKNKHADDAGDQAAKLRIHGVVLEICAVNIRKSNTVIPGAPLKYLTFMRTKTRVCHIIC
jgi:hypothetical protein